MNKLVLMNSVLNILNVDSSTTLSQRFPFLLNECTISNVSSSFLTKINYYGILNSLYIKSKKYGEIK